MAKLADLTRSKTTLTHQSISDPELKLEQPSAVLSSKKNKRDKFSNFNFYFKDTPEAPEIPYDDETWETFLRDLKYNVDFSNCEGEKDDPDFFPALSAEILDTENDCNEIRIPSLLFFKI